MSYRNDHDAALARVDALEQEVAKLRASAPAAPHKEHGNASRGGMPVLAVAGSLVALVAGIAGGVAIAIGNEDASPRIEAQPPVVESVSRETLTACATAIAARPALLDADNTDPHRAQPVSVGSLHRTGAACRDELRAMAATASRGERDALGKWAAAEDELAGTISRIQVYYSSDPYKLDGYATAKQLWVEYDRALDGRDGALRDWRVKFTRS